MTRATDPRGLWRLLLILGGWQALAVTVAMALGIGLVMAWFGTSASLGIRVEACREDLSQSGLVQVVARLGEPRPERWQLRRSTPRSGTITWTSDGSSPPVYPDDLVPALGCDWNHQISLATPPLPDLLATALRIALPLAFLVLAIAHAGTRRLPVAASIRSAWRLPGRASAALAVLIAIQAVVALRYPGFLKDIGDRQQALLGSEGVLAVLLLAPLAEELWFRATALRMLAEHGYPRAGWVATSLAFAVMHGVASSDWRVVMYHWTILFLLGLVLGGLWLRTRNWAACVLLHTLNNLLALGVWLSD